MNDILGKFRLIANGQDANNVLQNGDDTAIVMDDNNRLGASAKSDCLARHMIYVSADTQRSIDENNRARTLFYAAVACLFTPRNVQLDRDENGYAMNVHVGRPDIPESVLKELEMNNFKLDEQGRATSGKPLTARRVKRVLDAIAKVLPDVTPIAAKTQAVQKDVIGLGGAGESLPPDSDERTRLMSGIKLQLNDEIRQFMKDHNVPENSRTMDYRSACRERIDSLVQAVIHSGEVKVGEWSKAAILRAIRKDLLQLPVPEEISRRCEVLPYQAKIPLTSEERGIQPSQLVKAIGGYPEILSSRHGFPAKVASFAKQFFTRHAREFRDYVETLPEGRGMNRSQVATLLDAAMNRFMTFLGTKLEQDNEATLVDFMRLFGAHDRDILEPEGFAERDDIAAGLFKEALLMAHNNPDSRDMLSGETARLFKGTKFSTLVRSPRPQVAQPVVEEIRVEAEQPKPLPVKTSKQVYAGLFEPTGDHSIEEDVRKKAPKGMAKAQVDALVGTAKDIAQREVEKIVRAFPDPLTAEQQERLEAHAWKLVLTIQDEVFKTISEDYFGVDQATFEKLADSLPVDGKLLDRLSEAVQKDTSDCATLKGLGNELETAFKDTFAAKLAQKLAARGNPRTTFVAEELGRKALEVIKAQIQQDVIPVRNKIERLPKSLVDDIESDAVAKIRAHFNRALESLAESIAAQSISYTAEEWNVVITSYAWRAWSDTAANPA